MLLPKEAFWMRSFKRASHLKQTFEYNVSNLFQAVARNPFLEDILYWVIPVICHFVKVEIVLEGSKFGRVSR